MQNTRISIITIGNELINGQRIDTNSVWLCRRLSEIGFDVAEKFAVGDDIKDINECQCRHNPLCRAGTHIRSVRRRMLRLTA